MNMAEMHTGGVKMGIPRLVLDNDVAAGIKASPPTNRHPLIKKNFGRSTSKLLSFLEFLNSSTTTYSHYIKLAMGVTVIVSKWVSLDSFWIMT